MKKRKENEGSPSIEPKKKIYAKGLSICHEFAAGIDIGDTFHAVAIWNKDSYEVREYPAFTEDLKKLVQWLVSEGITTAAIESTGIYWVQLYLMLEEAGIEPYLVNAKHAKNVTGRKKDDTDAIWLQRLHSCGLLQKSFQPDNDTRVLRTYVRQRKSLLQTCSDSVRRMQKALELMNIKLHTVISDMLGKTGMAMVKAILEGERSGKELLKYKDPRIKASEEIILKSLDGIYNDEYLFALRQAYDEYHFYQTQVDDCDEMIRKQLIILAAKVTGGEIIDTPLKKKVKKNMLRFDVQTLLKIIIGVDLLQVPGISEISALELFSEIGWDMSKWKNNKHFSAWLNLSPNTKITGGKIISSRMQKKKNQAGQTLRMSANSVGNSKSQLGEYSRKMKSRLGKRGGIVATAHKLSRIIYTMIKEKKEYDAEIILQNQEKLNQNRIKYYEDQIQKLKKAC